MKITGQSLCVIGQSVKNMHHPDNGDYRRKKIDSGYEGQHGDDKAAAVHQFFMLTTKFPCLGLAKMISGSTFKKLPAKQITVEQNGQSKTDPEKIKRHNQEIEAYRLHGKADIVENIRPDWRFL